MAEGTSPPFKSSEDTAREKARTRLLACAHSFGTECTDAGGKPKLAFWATGIACSVTAAPLALAAKSLAGLTVQVLGIGLLRAA